MPFSKLQNVWDNFVLIFFLLLSQFEKQLSEVGELTQKARILPVVSQSACHKSLLSAYCILDTGFHCKATRHGPAVWSMLSIKRSKYRYGRASAPCPSFISI